MNFEQEKIKLAEITSKISKKIKYNNNEQELMLEDVIEDRRHIWDEYSHGALSLEGLREISNMNMLHVIQQQQYERLASQQKNYRKMVKNPYFARIDILEKGEQNIENIYIGRNSFIDEDSSDVLICDWRAEISEIFYNSELGKTSYNIPNGSIDVDLLLRRQFKIENGELLIMFDNDIVINDDILQMELGKTSDTKLKTIISTIQKEQNSIIRDISYDLLLVQGSAGSGKTSIALHRIAFLLYRYRKNINSQNVLIFSPNNIFNAYISDVLPELGEEKVVQTGFSEYFSAYLPKKYTINDALEQVEMLLNIKNNDEKEKLSNIIRQKGSVEMIDKITDYFEKNKDKFIRFDDLKYFDQILWNKNSFIEMHNQTYKNDTLYVRKNKIKNIVLEWLEDPLNKVKETAFKKLDKKITNNGINHYSDHELEQEHIQFWMESIDIITKKIDDIFDFDYINIYLDILKQFFNNDIYEFTKKMIDNKIISYADLFPINFLQFLGGYLPVQHKISQIVIDECQDYSPVQYHLLNLIFKNAKFTILGDISQQINIFNNNIEHIPKIFPNKKSKFFKLNKSYRSTVEINNFLQKLQKNDDIISVERHGEPPNFIKYDNKTEHQPLLIKKINELKTKNFNSIAIICKTQTECEILYAQLKDKTKVRIIENNDILKHNETVIIPVFLTKGLEFDAVIINNASDEIWCTDQDRQLLYVACSRALHSLTIFYKNDLTTLII